MDCAQCERIGATGDWHQGVRVIHHHHDAKVAQDQGFKLAAARLYDEQLHLLLSKNADYSPLNISDAGFPDVMSGLTTRIGDKYYRIRNLLEKGENAKHESLMDSFLDLSNYGLIAALCLRGEWPGVAQGGKRA